MIDCERYHAWSSVRHDGVNEYFECQMCGRRMVKRPTNAYQPIDEEWLRVGMRRLTPEPSYTPDPAVRR